MAETSFERLDYRVPLDRATVRQVGPGWDTPGTMRDDVVTHLPLTLSGPAVVPRPPAPTEEQLCVALYERVTATRYSADQLSHAQAAAELARQHMQRCRERVASFDGLDDQLARATVEALRSGNGIPRVGMDEEHREKVRERDLAWASLRAAESAEQLIASALADAHSEAENAATAARKAAAAVLAIEAEQLAVRHAELLAEAAEVRNGLAQFDRCVTGTGVTLPDAVLSVLLDPAHGVNLIRDIGTGEWSEKMNGLLTIPED